ncbi:MAG: ABC transporter substrate-binding protein [Acidimicrobiia bacterium]|nr:ABC transporter substrate-binding protein [Acidimicrobiia bacterium]MBT8192316.1 ABC transporter substrate-binding protein [Acidimicrobiia bacterium]NNF88359.1 ABC transporter substrate-binding protein [Acidimicrobiia bacterium]NNJ48161.1 ABC transporter substrate-binding protein [Acidimicrobiia bacterium]NNL14888.1 ABC transporter substrate-binding protein [Acidimicrobiia bacterium]
MRKLFRNRILGATVVALALVAAACGSGEDADTEGPTIVVGSTNFGEQEILGEIFAQALENAGYPVETKFQLGSREVVNPALKDGEIDLMAEYTGTLLTFEGGTSSTDSDQTHNDLIAVMEPQGITVLDYAPAQDKNGFVVTAETAAEYGFEKVSDLASENGNLVLGGPPECPERPLCLQGLSDVYGLDFASFQPLDVGGPLTVAALEGGEIEVGLLFTSDGVIAAKGFVLLEDDENLQPAENIVPVLRTEVLDQYDSNLSDLLNDVAAEITTAELSELNKRFGIDAEDADTLAKEWLADNGF